MLNLLNELHGILKAVLFLQLLDLGLAVLDEGGSLKYEKQRRNEENMRISTKGRYALRLMLDLALNNTGEPISLKDIARRQEISDKYLEQIISVLNKAKYVKSIRGAQGGYILTKRPEEYTVGMILRLTEGSLAPVACVEDEDTCDKMNDCATVLVWKKMNEAINQVVDSITLADLVDYERQRAGEYVI